MKLRLDHIQLRFFSLGFVLLTGVVLIPQMIMWAISPIEPVSIVEQWDPIPPTTDQDTMLAINIAAFDVKLVPEVQLEQQVTQASVVSTPSPKPQPPQLMLLGTALRSAEDGGESTRVAIIYDIREDVILFVKNGETIGSNYVESVSQEAVRITVLDQVYNLPLEGQPRWEVR